MAIVKMKRLRVVALAEQRDKLLSRLLHVGCVEVTEPDAQLTEAEWASVLGRDIGAQGAVKAEVNAVSAAMEALKKYAPVKSGLFTVRPDITEEDFFDETRRDKALSAAQEINDRVAEIGQLYSEENRLRSAMESFTPWKNLEEPLDIQSTEHVEITLGTLPAVTSVEEAKGKLAEQAPGSELILVSTNKELHHLVLLALKEEYSQALEALKPFSFSVVKFKDVHGNAAENLVRLDGEIAQVEEKRARAAEAIKALGGQRDELKLAFDRLNQDAAVEAVKDNSLTDGTICVLEGWTPAPKLDKLEKELKALDCAYELTDPQEGDEVPTLLENPKWMRGINMVTEMYSLPSYDGIDPNPLMFFWYVFFFGFMFADVAYGLIIWIASAVISKKFKPKNTLGYMFSLGQWLGFSTFFCGIFVGGFFGNVITTFSETFLGITQDQFPLWLNKFCSGIVVNPVEDPMTVLIIALAVGCVHLIFGQCIHIYMGFRDGTPLEGILDVVPWWIVFAGVACLALGGPKWVILLGVLALICTQGRAKKGFVGKLFGGIASLYDVTSWLGDVLSYARLMALMLATSVIAMVFNTLAAMPKLLIVFIVVFLIGHVFNIGVNLIGTYVHAARLQYLEFFGKFYKEGGIPFRPLKYNTKYVDVINKEEN
jgi:V/A-type H+-transporting ATPase subunit I